MISIQPITQWPRKPSNGWKTCRFDTTYSQTVELLDRELRYLGAHSVALQLWIRPDDIRIDGQMRANCQPSKPGVILTFTGKHGHVTMPCDTYGHWHYNLRAIALSLEALRTVDRYGVTTSGEQYKGWKQLPSGIEMGPVTQVMTVEEAAREISRLAGVGERWEPMITAVDTFRTLKRSLSLRLHPDVGGRIEEWHHFQNAVAVLEKHHGLS